MSRLYEFSWDFIGDIAEGRPNLGNTARIEVYRLFQYTMRDVLEERYGTEQTDKILYDAGYKAGLVFAEKFIGPQPDLDTYLEKLEKMLLDLNIGILRMERSNKEANTFTLTVSEDLDCSGLPDLQHVVCTYDEGFIAGVFKYYTPVELDVKEVDCWCTGDRTCRFEVQPKE